MVQEFWFRLVLTGGRTSRHVFTGGSIIKANYCSKVLESNVRLILDTVSPNFIFMDDNVKPHRTTQVSEGLAWEDIQQMDKPVHSLDLNPIEHVYDPL